MYYLAEGVLFFTASTKAVEDKYSESHIIFAILYIAIGLATLYGIRKNRPYFLLPLMAYTVKYTFMCSLTNVLQVLCIIVLVFVMLVIIIRHDEDDLDYFAGGHGNAQERYTYQNANISDGDYRVIVAIISGVFFMAILLKVWFLKAVYDCFKYIKYELCNSA
uniref:EpsG family protein n=1 Tax=Steinernema glaseri TaxID=37863 RepID=A0A1I7ZW09_9BILA